MVSGYNMAGDGRVRKDGMTNGRVKRYIVR